MNFTKEQLLELDRTVEAFRVKHALGPAMICLMLQLLFESYMQALKEFTQQELIRRANAN